VKQHQMISAFALSMVLAACGPKKGVEAPAQEQEAAPAAQCAMAGDCGPGLECVQGTCVQIRVASTAAACRSSDQCGPGEECKAGKCAAVQGGGGILVPLPNPPAVITGTEPAWTGPPVGMTQPADHGAECLEDADCGTGTRCHGGWCQAADGKTMGEACDGGSSCAYGLDCVDDLCTRMLTLGEPCMFDEDCGYALLCIGKKCAERQAKVGEACSITMDCDGPDTITVCLDGKCTPIGGGAMGAVCEIDDDCTPSLVCNAYRCAQGYAKIGQKCYDDVHCESGYCVLGKCRMDLLAEGAACKDDMDCSTDMCIAGKCRFDFVPLGGSCLYNSDCDIYFCVMGKCAEKGLGAGQACKRDLDCALPLACIAGACTDHLAKAGEKCGIDADCAPGLGCKKGKCKV